MNFQCLHITNLVQFGLIVYLCNDKYQIHNRKRLSKTSKLNNSQDGHQTVFSENQPKINKTQNKPDFETDLENLNTSNISVSLSINAKPSTPDGKKIIYFMHMHNTAGTAMCRIAVAQSKNKNLKSRVISNPRQNCNVFLKLPMQVEGAFFGHATPCCGETIEQQEKFAKNSKFTFVANEMYLPNELDYKNYDFITILRDPWDRYKSHFAHDFSAQFHQMKWYKEKFGREKAMSTVFVAKNFTDWVSSQRDNYFTRKICGEDCMEVPRGKLNSSHLEKAKSRLDKFSAVMILENLNQSLDILRSRFNWKIPTEYQNKTKISKTGVNSANKSRLQGVDQSSGWGAPFGAKSRGFLPRGSPQPRTIHAQTPDSQKCF